MNISQWSRKSLIAIGVAATLAACTAAPVKPDGAASLRSRLTQLQSNPELASRAPLAMKEADAAVAAAEKPQTDKVVATHLVFMADRKISIAEAQAQSHLAVDQRKAIGEQREAMRLQARTQEADAANTRAVAAQADASAAHADASDAQRNSLELQKQIEGLQAEATDRGLVLTLGDVLFNTNTAVLNAGTGGRLGKLAAFLNKYPERTALIEGYTDNTGSDAYNQALSERRADAVKGYLIGQGIGSNRLVASGNGEGSPVADNTSADGRQQNRRVEVIIENAVAAAR